MQQEKIWEAYQDEADLAYMQGKGAGRLDFIAKQIPIGVKVLNIGIGNGRLEEPLPKKGIDVSCLDPNEKSIFQLRERLNLGEKSKVGYSQQIPFDNELFDYVVMSEVLEHLEADAIDQTFSEVMMNTEDKVPIFWERYLQMKI